MAAITAVSSAYLVFVFGDVGVDLVQRRHTVKLTEVQAGLLCQVGTHVLITDSWHTGDIRVVPGEEFSISYPLDPDLPTKYS